MARNWLSREAEGMTEASPTRAPLTSTALIQTENT